LLPSALHDKRLLQRLLALLTDGFFHRRERFKLRNGIVLVLNHFYPLHQLVRQFQGLFLQLRVFFLEPFSCSFPVVAFWLHGGLYRLKF
ncbi:MAG: hypothetical protein ACK55I_50520, partial [bacterium]